METTVYGYCHKCRDALASPSLLCSSCAAQVEGSASPRQESEQGHAFHTNLSAEDRASFDAFMREASRFIQAGTLDPDLTLSEVLAVSLSLAHGDSPPDRFWVRSEGYAAGHGLTIL